jgi:hypothetical protein
LLPTFSFSEFEFFLGWQCIDAVIEYLFMNVLVGGHANIDG